MATTNLPSLPDVFTYLYTSVYPPIRSLNDEDDDSGINAGEEQYLSYLASLVGISSCSGELEGNGGKGDLKVGVTVLTATSNVYARAQITAPPSSPAPVIGVLSLTTINAAPVPGILPVPIKTAPSIPVMEPSTPPPLPKEDNLSPNEQIAGSEIVTLGSSRLTVSILPLGSGYILDGTTIQVGGPAATLNGVVVTANANGLQTLAPEPSISGSGYTIDGMTLSAGGPAAIVNGVTITANTNGLETLTSVPASGTVLPVPSGGSLISLGGNAYTISSIKGTEAVVLADKTLVPGGIVVVDGFTMSWEVDVSSLVVEGQSLRTASPTPDGSSLAFGKSEFSVGKEEGTSSRKGESATALSAQVNAAVTKSDFEVWHLPILVTFGALWTLPIF